MDICRPGTMPWFLFYFLYLNTDIWYVHTLRLSTFQNTTKTIRHRTKISIRMHTIQQSCFKIGFGVTLSHLGEKTVRLVTLGMRKKQQGGGSQQRKVRSLFLQPTWQHTVVSMLLSRLDNWGPKLLLRLSKLLCSPVDKPRTTKGGRSRILSFPLVHIHLVLFVFSLSHWCKWEQLSSFACDRGGERLQQFNHDLWPRA